MLAAAASILGFVSILVRASDLGPQAISFWRLCLSLPFMAAWFVFDLRQRHRRGARFTLKPPGWKALGLAGALFAADLAFWHAGIKLTTVANATLLANLTPILVAIAAWVLFGEKITRGFVFAGSLAIIGAVCLASANVQFAPERLTGDILSALTSVWYAAYLLAVRAARRAGAATVQVMFWATVVGTPLALMITVGFNEPLMPPTLADWWPLLTLAVVIHVGGQGGIAYGLGHTPAALATLIILIQPIVSTAAGWLLFGEALTPVQWLGAALVLLGIYAAQRFRLQSASAGG